jgi:hypothetical protein
MKPDLIIGPRDNPQTLRYHLLRWRGYQLSLHKWIRSDDDRALHDHVGWNVSLILNAGYLEVLQSGPVWRKPWRLYFRHAETPHRIVLVQPRPVYTLWLRGPPVREWGFLCPKGWRHWREYCERGTAESGSHFIDVSTVGRGCE